jgi:anti-anti-sigma regulatory factor
MMETFMLSEKAFINITEDTDTINLTWKGTIDSDYANTVMRDFLMDFHEKCKQKSISKLITDFRGVKFMFSSGIKTLIGWFKLFSDENKYTVSVVYNNKIRWQDVTFESIQMIIKGIELIVKEGPVE